MKLIDVLLLAAVIVFLTIGVHQSISFGFLHSYWIFMLALAAWFAYNNRKNKREEG